MFDRASIVRPLSRFRIVAGEVNRDGKCAARRAAPAYTRSVHVHRADEPSSGLLPLSPLRAVHTFEQPIRWRVYIVRRRCSETAAVRHAQKSASLFSGAIAISPFISGI